jgi:hypothetical protein
LKAKKDSNMATPGENEKNTATGTSELRPAISVPEDIPAATALVTELARLDARPWYQKPNLRTLYFLMFPACMGVEYTSGFDSSMMNGIQTIDPWETCKFRMGRICSEMGCSNWFSRLRLSR